jgi:hypothetical protein
MVLDTGAIQCTPNLPSRRSAAAGCTFSQRSRWCCSAQRKGDEAAALGRWGEAVADYEDAVRGEPGSADLQSKLQNARKQVSAAEAKRGQGCASQGDWDRALAAVDAALR